MLQGGSEAGFAKIEQENPWLSTTPLVVKPDQLIKRRGKAGLLAVNKTWPEVQAWVAERMGKNQQVCGTSVVHRMHYTCTLLTQQVVRAPSGSTGSRHARRCTSDPCCFSKAVLVGTVLWLHSSIPQLLPRHERVTKISSSRISRIVTCASQWVGVMPAAVASGCVVCSEQPLRRPRVWPLLIDSR